MVTVIGKTPIPAIGAPFPYDHNDDDLPADRWAYLGTIDFVVAL